MTLRLKQSLGSVLLAGAMWSAGCTASVGYRVYDPYRSDYHVWNRDEGGNYDRWVVETHRPHTDYKKLKPEDQKSYWNWRHDHDDHH
jgi:hypothetical protein